jgi:hypothetical protein
MSKAKIQGVTLTSTEHISFDNVEYLPGPTICTEDNGKTLLSYVLYNYKIEPTACPMVHVVIFRWDSCLVKLFFVNCCFV